MESERKLYSQVKLENEETSLSLSQWLHPSKLPLSYLSLLNEESTFDEKPPLDYVLEKVALQNRDVATGSRRGIGSEEIGCSKVKPSLRVQSLTNNETYEGSTSKVPVAGQSSSKSEHPLSQNYSEKRRNWRERSNNRKNNNCDFPQLCGRYRVAPSKRSNQSKIKAWTTECERKQRIEDNIKALREFLPHEIEDTPELILNEIIAHVKLLQLQMKELSRGRLGGEPISHPLISIEGYGHYINHEKMMTKPLEEIMTDMFANDPEAAASLLQSKGLYLMPLSSVQGFC